MQEAGFPGYRRSDAGVLALLLQQPLAIGQLGEAMGISRQAARQMADGLVERGYATFGTDDADARRTLVVLTPRGKAYGRAIWTAQTLSTRRCGAGLAKRTSPRPTPCSELCSPTRTPASEWTSGCPRQARVRYSAGMVSTSWRAASASAASISGGEVSSAAELSKYSRARPLRRFTG